MPNPTLEIHRHRVVPLVTFESLSAMRFTLVTEDPENPNWLPYTRIPVVAADPDRPPIDWLGMSPADPTVSGRNVDGVPAVALTCGEHLYVRLKRVAVAADAPLVVRVTGDARVTAGDGAEFPGGRLPDGDAVVLRLEASAREATAVADGAGSAERLEVRLGDKTIGVLAVRVYPRLTLRLRLHRIQPQQGSTLGARPSFPAFAGVLAQVNGIWRQAGVRFEVARDGVESFRVTHSPDWVDNQNEGETDLPALLERVEDRMINVFMIPRYKPGSRTDGTMGNTYAISPWTDALRASRPAIFFAGADQDGSAFWSDDDAALRLGTMLSHEIGHYLGMHHPQERGDANPEYDAKDVLGAQVLLMHNTLPCGYMMPVGIRFDAPSSESLYRSGSATPRYVALSERYNV